MKRSVLDNFGFYAILTEPVRGYEYIAKLLVEYEINFLQLRMKDVSEFKIFRMAEKLCNITDGTKTRLIINDYPRIAADSGADGVHIGQDDMSFDLTYEIVGPGAIIGISTHNPDQTEKACEKCPDYIGIGPVYVTPTKMIPDSVIGLRGMKAMLDKATVPAVCIGGISKEKLSDVLKNGARNFSMVRPLCSAQNPEKVLKEILKIYSGFRS